MKTSVSSLEDVLAFHVLLQLSQTYTVYVLELLLFTDYML